MDFTESVKQALKDQGRKKKWLAKFLDIDPQTLSNKITGKVDWTESEKIAISIILNIPSEALDLIKREVSNG